MNKNEKIDLILKAQDNLLEAIELLDEAIGDDRHARAYLIEQIQILASNDHGFLCSDFNCDKLIKQIENEEDDEDE